MRVAVDAMGGDHAPGEIVQGVLQALERIGGDEVVLVGCKERIEKELSASASVYRQVEYRISVVEAPELIAMDEPPVEAVRRKPNSSLVRAAALAADGEVDAVISAGNTGACVAVSQMKMHRLPGAHRPGIAVVIPTFDRPCVMCDVGANISCRPRHLHQYALMAAEYAEFILGTETPRVGLLSIGQEVAKGNTLTKQSHDLLKNDNSLNFVGNVEGRDIFLNKADVIVSDGFVGNVVLKLIEGVGEGLFKGLAKEMGQLDGEVAGKLGPLFQEIYHRHDYREYGGAPLLGVKGVSIICHGSSDRLAIRNAIRVSREVVTQHVNERIMTRLARAEGGKK